MGFLSTLIRFDSNGNEGAIELPYSIPLIFLFALLPTISQMMVSIQPFYRSIYLKLEVCQDLHGFMWASLQFWFWGALGGGDELGICISVENLALCSNK